ncbi:hypothetical protein ACFL1B_06050 [Nanoarchaeota archaeon]
MIGKKGDIVWGHLVAIALVLFVLLAVVILGKNIFTGFRESTEYCPGRCQSACYGVGEWEELRGKAGCPDSQRCCNSEAIQAQLQQQAVAAGQDPSVNIRDAIAAWVVQRDKEYKPGNKIGLLIGEQINFVISIASDIQDKADSRICKWNIIDERGSPAIVLQGNQYNTAGGTCQIGQSTPTSTFGFGSEQANQYLALEVIIVGDIQDTNNNTRRGEIGKATFPIQVTNPVYVSGITSRWVNEAEITVTCDNAVLCKDVSLWAPTSSELCYSERGPSGTPGDIGQFFNNQAIVKLHSESSLVKNNNNLLNSNLCVTVRTQAAGGDEFSSTFIGTWTDRPVMIDTGAPTVGYQDNVIQCQDGSGCKHYYTYVRTIVSTAQFNQMLAQGSVGGLSLGSIGQTLKDSFMTQMYSAMATFTMPGLGKCPPVGSEYRMTTNGYVILPNTAISGTLCYYAKDEAGNAAEVQSTSFQNKDVMVQMMNEWAVQKGINTLNNPDTGNTGTEVLKGLCGNFELDTGEQCDMGNLQGRTCRALGFSGGSLSCGLDCQFDTSGCEGVCGNNKIEGSESCDGNAFFPGWNCQMLGFSGGTLGCTDECEVDNTACTI